MNPAFIPIIGSVVRHVLTAGGGAAVGAAVTSPDNEIQTLAGAIATILGFILSYMEKRKRK